MSRNVNNNSHNRRNDDFPANSKKKSSGSSHSSSQSFSRQFAPKAFPQSSNSSSSGGNNASKNKNDSGPSRSRYYRSDYNSQRYHQEGYESSEYARYSDEYSARSRNERSDLNQRRSVDDGYSGRSAARANDPWSRNWSYDYDDDAYSDSDAFERDDFSRSYQRMSRTEWGRMPDSYTAASVAIVVDPSLKKQKTAKKQKNPYVQFAIWARSGFSSAKLPTKKAINIVLLTTILGALVLSVISPAVTAYKDYKTLTGLIKSGETSLIAAFTEIGFSTKTSSASAASVTPQQMQIAQNDVNVALADFTELHARLSNPDYILQLGMGLPSIGSVLKTAAPLTQIAVDAVIMVSKGLPTFAAAAKLMKTSPLSSTSVTQNSAPILTSQDIATMQNFILSIAPQVNDILAVLSQTPPSDIIAAIGKFSPKYAADIGPFLALAPQLPNALATVAQFLQIAPSVLGISNGPVGYLLMTLDNSEIRPIGGFQGQYALISINGGRVGHINLQDVYLLEPKTSAYNNMTPQTEYWWLNSSGEGYSLRNSGLAPDFPTSAQYALTQFVNEPLCTQWDSTGQICVGAQFSQANLVPIIDAKTGAITGYDPTPIPMAGFIAIQSTVIAQFLQVIGSVKVGCPYNVTVNPSNLIPLIHYYQLTAEGRKQGQSSCGIHVSDSTKRFTAMLTQILLTQAKSLSKAKLLQFAGILFHDLQTRDIQVYFSQPEASGSSFPANVAAEKFLSQYGASSQMYTGNQDSLVMNQANFIGDKMNMYLSMALNDTVNLQNDGSATHNLTINYNFHLPNFPNNPTPQQISNVLYNATGLNYYAEYRRIYTAPNSTFISSTGFSDPNIYDAPNSVQPQIYTPNTSDVPNHTIFGGYYLYEWNTNANGQLTFTPATGVLNPTLSWNAQGVILNGVYYLNLQPQSGMPTSYSVTINPPSCSSNKTPEHFSGSLTTAITLTMQTPGC